MPFCRSCGTQTRLNNVICAQCETEGKTYASVSGDGIALDGYSRKSYKIAIILAGVFGLMGIHHFYLRNWLHGLFDFGLFVFGFWFVFISKDPTLNAVGASLIIVDLIHTLIITYQPIVGKCRDGDGLLLIYPGQKV